MSLLLIISSLICIQSHDINYFLIGRSLQGIATGSISVAARAMLKLTSQ